MRIFNGGITLCLAPAVEERANRCRFHGARRPPIVGFGQQPPLVSSQKAAARSPSSSWKRARGSSSVRIRTPPGRPVAQLRRRAPPQRERQDAAGRRARQGRTAQRSAHGAAYLRGSKPQPWWVTEGRIVRLQEQIPFPCIACFAGYGRNNQTIRSAAEAASSSSTQTRSLPSTLGLSVMMTAPSLSRARAHALISAADGSTTAPNVGLSAPSSWKSCSSARQRRHEATWSPNLPMGILDVSAEFFLLRGRYSFQHFVFTSI